MVNASFILAFMGLRDVDIDVGAGGGGDRWEVEEDEDEDVVAAVRVVIGNVGGGFCFDVDNKKRELINQSSNMDTCFAKLKVIKKVF